MLFVSALLLLQSASLEAGDRYYFKTFAGMPGGAGYHDATGCAARFCGPFGVAVDASGDLYVADFNNTVRKVTSAGAVTTVAGLAWEAGNRDGTAGASRFDFCRDTAVDAQGRIYVASTENHTIRRITPRGEVTTLAGRAGYPGKSDGIGQEARFNTPGGIAVDFLGMVYVADTYNHTIRKITPAGEVTTLAGVAEWPGYADGPAWKARFRQPFGIAVDVFGTIYVAEEANNTIRKISTEGIVSTLADGRARLNAPHDLAIDKAGNLYVADSGNSVIRKINPVGSMTIFAGSFQSTGSSDGPAQSARFEYPQSLGIDPRGNLFVTDAAQNTIRKVTPAGEVSTLAGYPSHSGYTNGIGSSARFDVPYGIAMDGASNLYVSEFYHGTIRKISPAGVVSTLAGSYGGTNDGVGDSAQFAYPSGVAVDSEGNLYVADHLSHALRKITPTGVVTTLAGSPGHPGTQDGVGSAARFLWPIGVAVDQFDSVYVTDRSHTLRKVSAGGAVTTLAGLTVVTGTNDGQGSAARFSNPQGLAVDALGNIYVADGDNYTIRKVTPAGVVTTIAGMAGQRGFADGIGRAARFYSLSGLAVDQDGSLIMTDGSAIRKLTVDGKVTTLGGSARSAASLNGIGRQARFNWPKGVTIGPGGSLYLVNTWENTVVVGRKLPAILREPRSVTVALGQTAVFSTLALDDMSLRFQWYKDGIALTRSTRVRGVACNVLTIRGVRAEDAGTYTVQVSDAAGSINGSAAAELIIEQGDFTGRR